MKWWILAMIVSLTILGAGCNKSTAEAPEVTVPPPQETATEAKDEDEIGKKQAPAPEPACKGGG